MIIAVHNTRGGVGTTTIAAHLCKLIQELSITVDAMSADPTQELQRWLQPLGVRLISPETLAQPCRDDDENLADVLVIDLHTSQAPPITPDLWVIPISDRLALVHAIRLTDSLSGDVVWLPTMGRKVDLASLPRYLEGVVALSPALPFSRAIRAAGERHHLVWGDSELAGTAGALSLRRSLRHILDSAGLTSDELALHHTSAAVAAPGEHQDLQPAQA